MRKMTFGRFDYASFASFAAYAVATVAIPVALVQLTHDLGFALEDGGTGKAGWLSMTRSVAICLSLVVSGFVAGRWGNRRPLGISQLLIAAGMFACAVSPSFGFLLFALIIAGSGEGIVEGLGTPFVQLLHEKEPGRYMNFSHGFWSFGILFATPLFGFIICKGVSWRWILLFASVFALLPAALMLAPQRKRIYPERAERLSVRRIASQAKAIMRTPRFWLFFCAMIFAGGAEIGITFWCSSMVQLEFGGTVMQGGIATAVFAAGMLAGRTGFGFLLRQSHLKGLVIGSGILAALTVSFFPALARSELAWKLYAFYALLFVAGIGTAPHWPSIQTYAVEKMPQLDSTMVYVMLSCAGIPGSGIVTLLIGYLGKYENIGLVNAFYLIPACFTVMALLILSEKTKKQKLI